MDSRARLRNLYENAELGSAEYFDLAEALTISNYVLLCALDSYSPGRVVFVVSRFAGEVHVHHKAQ